MAAATAIRRRRGRAEMAPRSVRGFADGRVFSGEQAKELGLVDELG